MFRVSRSTGGNDNSFGVVKIACVILGLVDGSGIIPPQPKVEGQLRRGLVVIFNESAIGVLAIAEVCDCRDCRCDRDSKKHVSQAISAAVAY